MISYGAGLAAPSLMGGVADITWLRLAFGLAAAIAVMIAASAGMLSLARRDRTTSQEPACCYGARFQV